MGVCRWGLPFSSHSLSLSPSPPFPGVRTTCCNKAHTCGRAENKQEAFIKDKLPKKMGLYIYIYIFFFFFKNPVFSKENMNFPVTCHPAFSCCRLTYFSWTEIIKKAKSTQRVHTRTHAHTHTQHTFTP